MEELSHDCRYPPSGTVDRCLFPKLFAHQPGQYQAGNRAAANRQSRTALDDACAGVEGALPSQVIEVPEHIRLTIKGKERAWRVPPVNRREVLRRDHHTCQYCGSTHNLTLDHVVPLSKGGSHSWDNVVTACERCNQRKGNRTPEEANMPLRSKPRAPLHPTVAFAEQFWREHQSRQE